MNAIETNNITIVENYYNAILAKDFATVESSLHDQVYFIGPLAELHGKAAVVDAAKNLSQMLTKIDIRVKLANTHQVMFAYDFLFPEPIGLLRASVLMELQDQLITRIELFYDGRPFFEKKDDIFKKN